MNPKKLTTIVVCMVCSRRAEGWSIKFVNEPDAMCFTCCVYCAAEQPDRAWMLAGERLGFSYADASSALLDQGVDMVWRAL